MIPLKQWVVEESRKHRVTMGAIYQRLAQGRYPGLVRRKVSGAWFVTQPVEYAPARQS